MANEDTNSPEGNKPEPVTPTAADSAERGQNEAGGPEATEQVEAEASRASDAENQDASSDEVNKDVKEDSATARRDESQRRESKKAPVSKQARGKIHKPLNIALLGMTGAGKSTVGRLLAHFSGFGLIDLDDWIEERAGKPIASIFSDEGESSFRELEKKGLEFLRGVRNHVIILGSGAIADDDNWNIVKGLGLTVYLECSEQEIIRRLERDDEALGARPLLADLVEEEDLDLRRQKLGDRISGLVGMRQKRFESADFTFNGGLCTPEFCARSLYSNIVQLPEWQRPKPWH